MVGVLFYFSIIHAITVVSSMVTFALWCPFLPSMVTLRDLAIHVLFSISRATLVVSSYYGVSSLPSHRRPLQVLNRIMPDDTPEFSFIAPPPTPYQG